MLAVARALVLGLRLGRRGLMGRGRGFMCCMVGGAVAVVFRRWVLRGVRSGRRFGRSRRGSRTFLGPRT
jgi:hypothetical protein